MTAAAIAGTFATYRHVPSRGVVQLVIEVPVESQAAAFEALGYPEPGKSLHVAVARLREEVMPAGPATKQGADSIIDTPPSSQTLGAGAQGSSAALSSTPCSSPVAPEGDENRGNRAFKRAIMLCKDPEFQRYSGANPNALYHVAGTTEVHAASFLRTRCQIASRNDLKHDEAARKRFDQMVTDYDIWRGRLPEVRG